MLNEDLLRDARDAQERLIDAEHAAELARADFHRAVRRLQLGGASMRQLASALGLSHQRVHQIVEAAGGSRRWRKDHGEGVEPRSCSFCGREQPTCKKLVAGPGVFVCERCVAAARAVQATGQPATTPVSTMEPVGPGGRARCSFCGKQRRQVAGLTVALGTGGGSEGRKWPGEVHVCSECLVLCDEILSEGLV